MQFFPVDAGTLINQTAQAAGNLFAQAPEGAFGGILSSFMEEGRSDYSGRPAGFSAYGPRSGTLTGEDARRFADALRKKGVDAGLVESFEKLAASGSPLTLGTAYKSLSASGRVTGDLEDDSRLAFKTLLGRLGLGKDEQEELLTLSDEGDIRSLMKRLEALFREQEGLSDLSPEELNSLLRGLDLSQSGREGLLAALAGGESISLDKSALQSILDAARAEQDGRDAASHHAQKHMRDIMADVLASKKAAELGADVADTRGNRRSEQSEALMHNSVRKHTGVDELHAGAVEAAERNAGERNFGEENFESRKDGRSRSERILEKAAEDPEAARATAKKSAEDPASLLARRIVAADNPVAAPRGGTAPQATANSASSTAAQHRQEIFSQVEQGILRNGQNGLQRLTLQLNPAELGQLTVVLSVQQGEVRATIRAENADAAGVLREQLAELRQSLEDQGLKVKELDVQSGLQGNDFAGEWQGSREHNLMYDSSERQRVIRLARARREAVREQAAAPERAAAPLGDNGLHVVA